MRSPTGGDVEALIVGVYPSAFHVSWSPPSAYDPRDESSQRRPLIASLAVDVELVVFWDGRHPAPAALLQQWKTAVGFDNELHGTVAVGKNGPSGLGLIEHFLDPLGITPAAVAFTDVIPWFFVKQGTGSQGDAIAKRFAPIAERLGIHPGSLPSRPTTRELPQIAASQERRNSLRQEIVGSGAALVITLGQEALDSIRAIADETGGVQNTLKPKGYGQIGHLLVEGKRTELMPLVHPGFRRQTTDASWRKAFDAWAASQSVHLTST